MKIGSNRRTRAATAARPSWRQRRHSPERHDPGAHPALERRKRLRLAQERGQEDRLRHPDRVGILGRDPPERELADLLAAQPDLAGLQKRVGLRLDVVEQPQLVEEVHGAGLEHLAAELAIEGLVSAVDPPSGVRVSHLDTFERLR
jgi:hypothetical protein